MAAARGLGQHRTAANSDHPPPRSSPLGATLQISLVGLLVYACSRILTPFMSILLWSTILAVILHSLHRRLTAAIGNRWSALTIGLAGVALTLVPIVIAVTSIGSSLYWLVSGLQDQTLTCRRLRRGSRTSRCWGRR